MFQVFYNCLFYKVETLKHIANLIPKGLVKLAPEYEWLQPKRIIKGLITKIIF